MDAADRFRELVRAPGPDVRLDEAALCIAARAQPGLDVDAWCARLDELAAECSAPSFDAVLEELFVRRGFAGATDDYADPRNSFLDAVLERRRGIPISLSVVVIEVARRLGVVVHGVGMPGHFLVQAAGAEDIWCDPFAGGALLDVDGCRARFDALFRGERVLHPRDLAPTPPRAILARMLANLEQGPLGRDPRAQEWLYELHLSIPCVPAGDRAVLERKLTRVRAGWN